MEWAARAGEPAEWGLAVFDMMEISMFGQVDTKTRVLNPVP